MSDKQLKRIMNKDVNQTVGDTPSEEKLASTIIMLLEERVSSIDPAIANKLEQARAQAISRMQGNSQITASHAGVLHMLGAYINQHRALMSSATLGCAVLMAFLVTQQLVGRDSVEQGDAFLLGSELPPEAYADKGFDTWLAQNSQR